MPMQRTVFFVAGAVYKGSKLQEVSGLNSTEKPSGLEGL